MAALMKTEFDVTISEIDVLSEIADVWQPQHFTAMLDDMDYGETSGMSPAELREMCLLSLQDLEPADAAAVVLRCRFGDRLREGQVRNCSHEMLDEKHWEQYAEMSFHEDFFHVGSLLYEAFPREFPTPDAAHVCLEVKARDKTGKELLQAGVDEAFVVRLLADGMSDDAVLHRLFEDQIAGGPFPEAESIIWSFQQERVEDSTLTLNVLSSGYWLDSLLHVENFVSHSPQRGSAEKVAS